MTLPYTELFRGLFPDEAGRVEGETGAFAPDSYEREQMRELETRLRAKLATDRAT